MVMMKKKKCSRLETTERRSDDEGDGGFTLTSRVRDRRGEERELVSGATLADTRHCRSRRRGSLLFFCCHCHHLPSASPSVRHTHLQDLAFSLHHHHHHHHQTDAHCPLLDFAIISSLSRLLSRSFALFCLVQILYVLVVVFCGGRSSTGSGSDNSGGGITRSNCSNFIQCSRYPSPTHFDH